MRTTLLATAAAVASLAAAAPASAQTAAPCKIDLKDAAFDNTSTFNASPAAPVVVTPSTSLDLKGLKAQHDPSKGAAATTVSMSITNLSRKIPLGSTSTVWTVQWTAANGTLYFVRAVNDLADNLVFEWGEQVPPIGGLVLPRFEYRGATTGKFVPGENGLIEIVVPQALSAAGTVLADMFASTSEGRQVVPNAAATPSRGLSSPSDRAPDGTDTTSYTVAACPAA